MNEDSPLQDVLRSIRVTSAPPLGTSIGIDSPIQDAVANRLGFSGILDLETTVGSTAITVGRSIRLLGPIPGIVHDDRTGESPFTPADLTFPQREDDFGGGPREADSATRDTRGTRSRTDESSEGSIDGEVSPDLPEMESRDSPAPEPSDRDGEPAADAETATGRAGRPTDTSGPPTAAEPAWEIDELPTGKTEAREARTTWTTDPRFVPQPSVSSSTTDPTAPGATDAGPASDASSSGAGSDSTRVDDATASPESSGKPTVPFTLAGHRPMSVTVSQGQSDLPLGTGEAATGTVDREWDRPDFRAREEKKHVHSGTAAGDPMSADYPTRTRGESGQPRQSPPTGVEAGTQPDSALEPVDVDSEAGAGTADRVDDSSGSTAASGTGRDDATGGTPSRSADSGTVSPGRSRRVRPPSSAGLGGGGGPEPTATGFDRVTPGVDVSSGAGSPVAAGHTRPTGEEPGTTFIERLVTRSAPGSAPIAGGSGTVHRSLGASPPSLQYPEPPGGGADASGTEGRPSPVSPTDSGPTVTDADSRSVDEPTTGDIGRDPGTTDEEVPTVDAEPPGETAVESPPTGVAEPPGPGGEPASVVDPPGGAGATVPSTSGPRFPHLPHAGSPTGSAPVQDPASLEYLSPSAEGSVGQADRAGAGRTGGTERTGRTERTEPRGRTGGSGRSASSTSASRRQPTGGDIGSTGASGRPTTGSRPRSTASTAAGSDRESTGSGPAPITGPTDLAAVPTPPSETETEWVTETVPLRVATPVDRRVADSDASRASSPASQPIETVTTTTVEPGGATDQAGATSEAARRSVRLSETADVAGTNADVARATSDRDPRRHRTVRRIHRQPTSERTEPGSQSSRGTPPAPDLPDLEPVRRGSVEDDVAGTAEETDVIEETVEEVSPLEPPTDSVADARADLESGRAVRSTGTAAPDMTVTDPNRLQRTQASARADESGLNRRVVRRIRRRTRAPADATGRSAAAGAMGSPTGTSPRMTVTDPARLGRSGGATGGADDEVARRAIRQARTGATASGATAVDDLDIDAPELAEIRETGPSRGPRTGPIGDLPIALEPSGPGEVGTGVVPTEKLKHSQKSTTKEMPTLTVQSSTTDRTAPSEEAVEELQEELRRVNREASGAGGLELGGSNAEIRERIEEAYVPQPATPAEPSIEPEMPAETSSPRDRSGPGREVGPSRAETEQMFPDFTFRRPAPKVDVTTEPEPRDITYREPETSVPDRPRDTGFERADVTDIAKETGKFGHSADVDRMIERLQREIERRRRIDRERRGL